MFYLWPFVLLKTKGLFFTDLFYIKIRRIIMSEDLTKGNINKTLIKFAFPIFIANMLQSVYGIVDMIFVGRFVGGKGIAALNSAVMITFIITSICMGITMGGSVLVSKYKGENNGNKIKDTISTLFSISMIFALIVTLISLIIYKKIFIFMNLPSGSLQYANSYMKIISFGIIFIFGYNAATSVIKGLGDSKSPLTFVFIASIVNIILDYILIGLLHIGVNGAAYATIISQAVSFIISIIYLNKHDFIYKLKITNLYIKKDKAIKIIKIGFPCAVQMTILNVSYLIITKILNGYGLEITSAAGIGLKINSFAAMPCWAIGQSVTTIVSQNIGAEKIINVKKTVKAGIIYTLISSFLLIVLIQIFSYEIIELFNKDINIIKEGIIYLRICCSINFVAYGIMYTLDSFMTGLGDSFIAMLNSILQSVIIRILFSIILIHYFNLGYIGIYIAEFLSPILPGIFGIIYYLHFIKLNKAKEKEIE
ncbi:MATE efflux family protein [Anaerofustis stercorihominis DSM 17244]|uniref:Probable multidrug resistance protein NorM n=2 Tax=Anaerofustis stercorihominis TaxID=214853 RepID=B1C6R2_9FIRM|nr:MATE efflux family protein [Anaerofustis stercorihominis DSM 17244]